MNKKWVKRLVVTAVLGALNGPAAAESLQEVVSYAIANNPQVLTVANRRSAAEAGIRSARGGYYPKVDYVYGTGRAITKNPSTIAAGLDWSHLNRNQNSVVVNQMLWDGGGVKSEVDRRRAILESTDFRVTGTAEEIAQQAIDAYLDVLRNREQVTYAKENLAAHQKTFDQVKLRSDRGVGRRADLDQIDARLALAQSNLQAAESTLQDAEIAFERIVGKPPAVLNQAPPAPPTPKTTAEALAIATTNHPTLKSALADVDAAVAQRAAARALLQPRFELEYNHGENRNLLGIPGPYHERSVMLWAKMNIFRGGTDYYRISETQAQINEATEIANNTRRQVESAVRLAYNAYATARGRLPSLERYVKSSDSTRDAYSKQFAIGQRTLLDLLDSENEFFTARSTYLSGKYIELSAQYRVLAAIGQLLSGLGITPPVVAPAD
jgi:adhesin transport system outer membrane protein